MEKLNEKQKLFVDEYLTDFNGTEAAKRAGYSEKTAHVQATALLKKPKIQEYMLKRKKERQRRTEVTQDRVVNALAAIAFGDIKDTIRWDERGRIKLRPMDDVDGTVIDEIKETVNESGRTLQVKRSDRMKALEMLARHIGLYENPPQAKVDVTHYVEALGVAAQNVWDEEDDGGE